MQRNTHTLRIRLAKKGWAIFEAHLWVFDKIDVKAFDVPFPKKGKVKHCWLIVQSKRASVLLLAQYDEHFFWFGDKPLPKYCVAPAWNTIAEPRSLIAEGELLRLKSAKGTEFDAILMGENVQYYTGVRLLPDKTVQFINVELKKNARNVESVYTIVGPAKDGNLLNKVVRTLKI